MLEGFFKPHSIAVIGASAHPEKLGAVVYNNIVGHKFRGKVYPVNVKGGKIGKTKIFSSVIEIPSKVDLAVIVIPALYVERVIRECGKKHIRSAVIISAGFGETGTEGKKREEKIVSVARASRVRLLGPNCLGIIVPRLKLNASFAEGLPQPGGVAVVSQSGAMAVAITDWALMIHIGFSALISLGNKSDIEEEELLNFFAHDQKTNVIVAYLESIKNGRKFLRTLKLVTQKKPVIILKPGKSMQAQVAVASHTGSLAGAYEVEKAHLEAAGAVVVDSLEELFMFTQTFEHAHTVKGKRVAVVTNAGGPGILATDALIGAGFFLATLSPETNKILKRKMPEAASLHNPIDVVGDAPASRYYAALSTVMGDKNVDAVIAILTHQYVTETEKIAKIIIQVSKKFKKPLFVSFIGGKGVGKGRTILVHHGIPEFSFPEQAVRALDASWKAKEAKSLTARFPDVEIKKGAHLVPLVGLKAETLLEKYIPFVLRSHISVSIPGALLQAKKIGYPVVAKVASASFLHKTESGFVRVNITSEKDLQRILLEWKKKISLKFKKGEGFVVQAYRPASLEVFLGSKRDLNFGPYLVCGVGGIFVEQLSGTRIFSLPQTVAQARQVLSTGILGAVLSSERGKYLPVTSLAKSIAGLSRMMIERADIAECDLNPVLVRPDGVYIPDVRILKIGA